MSFRATKEFLAEVDRVRKERDLMETALDKLQTIVNDPYALAIMDECDSAVAALRSTSPKPGDDEGT